MNDKLIPYPETTYLHLTRKTATDQSITGDMELKSLCTNVVLHHKITKPFGVLEKRWKGNEIKKSCIPPGLYPLLKKKYGQFYKKYKADFGHKFVLLIDEVPGRSEILVHVGNTEADTLGCLLVGDRTKNPNKVNQSVRAYKRFYEVIDHFSPTHLLITQEIPT